MLLFAYQDLYKSVGEDRKESENLGRFEPIHAAEMVQVAELRELRFVTSVTRPDEPMSSYAEFIHTVEESTATKEDDDMAKKLQALQLHLNSWRTESGN